MRKLELVVLMKFRVNKDRLEDLRADYPHLQEKQRPPEFQITARRIKEAKSLGQSALGKRAQTGSHPRADSGRPIISRFGIHQVDALPTIRDLVKHGLRLVNLHYFFRDFRKRESGEIRRDRLATLVCMFTSSPADSLPDSALEAISKHCGITWEHCFAWDNRAVPDAVPFTINFKLRRPGARPSARLRFGIEDGEPRFWKEFC